MGWGGVALAINGYPGVKQDYGTKAQDRMHDIATVVWVWAFVYCAAFSLLLLYRIVSQPRAFLATMHKPGESLFFGCVPMGVAVIAMGLVTFGQNVGLTGKQAHDGALVMFWCPPSVRHLDATPSSGGDEERRGGVTLTRFPRAGSTSCSAR